MRGRYAAAKSALCFVLLILATVVYFKQDSIYKWEKTNALKAIKYIKVGTLLYIPLASCFVGIGFPAESLNLFSGYFFGNLGFTYFGNWSTTVAYVSSCIVLFVGSTITFRLGRTYIDEETRLHANRKYEAVRITNRIIDEQGVPLITALRFIPFIPLFVVNCLCGSSSLPLPCFIITLVGCLPFTLFTTKLGADGSDAMHVLLHTERGILLLLFSAISFIGILGVVYRSVIDIRLRERHLSNAPSALDSREARLPAQEPLLPLLQS